MSFRLLIAAAFALDFASAVLSRDLRPSVPSWPVQFNSKFVVRIGEYGSDWNSTGVIFYDWTNKTFRADYINWCLPLFDSGPSDYQNYTCSFLSTAAGNMYFVNHTAQTWEDHKCCLFAESLGTPPPDWMKVDQYNGTAIVRNILCDVWWFPGTSDPENPCYGYWDDRNKPHRPVRFFGLSSLGPTTLDYHTFDVGPAPPNVSLTVPNKGCYEQCKPPSQKTPNWRRVRLPHFPSCG